MTPIELHNLGTYASIEAVWAAYPNGGIEGDYVTVSGTKYRWNKYDRQWQNASLVNETTAYQANTVDGDLNVSHDMKIANNATVTHDLNVLGKLNAQNVKQPNRGLFASSSALEAAYPNPEIGDWAVVGDTLPGDVYRCEEAGTWAATGETGGLDDVDLTNYVATSAIADNLTTNDAEKVLSAKQGKVLKDAQDAIVATDTAQNSRIKALEDATSLRVDVEYTTQENYIILRDSTRGNISSNNAADLRIYSVTEGQVLYLSFSDDIPSGATGAQACGWYSTSTFSSMESGTFTAVDGVNKNLAGAAGNDYTVTVPSGAEVLVVTVLHSVPTMVVQTDGEIGGRIDSIVTTQAAVDAAQNTKISSIESDVYENVFVEQTPTSVQSDKYIKASSSNGDIDTFGSGLYRLKVYAVTPGNVWKITNTQSVSTGGVVYCIYSCTNSADIGSSNKITGSGTGGSGTTTYNITIPANATWMAVTEYSGAVQSVTKQVTQTKYGGALEAVEEIQSRQLMHIKRDGDNVYVAYNKGDGRELCYWFGSIFNSKQNAKGFRSVYYRDVNRLYPSADGINAISTDNRLASQTGSDMIGPIAVDSIFCGGNHTLDIDGDETGSITNETISYVLDGTTLTDGSKVYGNELVVTVEHDVLAPNSGSTSTVYLLKETIVMTLRGGTLKVHVTHDYDDTACAGRTITTYYGMQSMFFGSLGSTKMLTPNGKYPVLTAETSSMSFKKSEYPNFNRFVQRNSNGWCQSAWVNPLVGIGNHSEIAGTDSIFLGGGGSSNKYYHKLIAGKTIVSGMEYEWEGAYRWDYDDGISIASDLAMAGTINQ